MTSEQHVESQGSVSLNNTSYKTAWGAPQLQPHMQGTSHNPPPPQNPPPETPQLPPSCRALPEARRQGLSNSSPCLTSAHTHFGGQ